MNYAELNKKVADVQLGVARITDVKAGEHKLEIVTGETEPTFLLVNTSTNKKHRISLAGIAAMRVVDDKKALKGITTVAQARESDDILNLQAALARDKSQISEATKFTVTGTLQIMEVDSDVNVYRNDAYKGYAAYLKKTRKIANELAIGTPERATAFTEASEELRASGVKTEHKGKEESYLTMPVFIVS